MQRLFGYFCVFSSSLVALQPCVGLGLLHGFVTVNIFRVGSLAPRPIPNLEDQGLHYQELTFPPA
jgi:hypothetical protein